MFDKVHDYGWSEWEIFICTINMKYTAEHATPVRSDFWVDTDNYTCEDLEKAYSCHCGGCKCGKASRAK